MEQIRNRVVARLKDPSWRLLASEIKIRTQRVARSNVRTLRLLASPSINQVNHFHLPRFDTCSVGEGAPPKEREMRLYVDSLGKERKGVEEVRDNLLADVESPDLLMQTFGSSQVIAAKEVRLALFPLEKGLTPFPKAVQKTVRPGVEVGPDCPLEVLLVYLHPLQVLDFVERHLKLEDLLKRSSLEALEEVEAKVMLPEKLILDRRQFLMAIQAREEAFSFAAHLAKLRGGPAENTLELYYLKLASLLLRVFKSYKDGVLIDKTVRMLERCTSSRDLTVLTHLLEMSSRVQKEISKLETSQEQDKKLDEERRAPPVAKPLNTPPPAPMRRLPLKKGRLPPLVDIDEEEVEGGNVEKEVQISSPQTEVSLLESSSLAVNVEAAIFRTSILALERGQFQGGGVAQWQGVQEEIVFFSRVFGSFFSRESGEAETLGGSLHHLSQFLRGLNESLLSLVEADQRRALNLKETDDYARLFFAASQAAEILTKEYPDSSEEDFRRKALRQHFYPLIPLASESLQAGGGGRLALLSKVGLQVCLSSVRNQDLCFCDDFLEFLVEERLKKLEGCS